MSWSKAIFSRKIIYSAVLANLLFPVLASARGIAVLSLDPDDPVPVPSNSQFSCSGLGGIVKQIFSACGPAGATTASELILGVINILLAIVGILAVLFVIIGGIRYITAHGNEEQAEGAKKTILHAVIGVVLVILSFAIITIIANALIYND